MSRTNYAAIDIGSNAVRLLIKSIDSEATDKSRFKNSSSSAFPSASVSTSSTTAFSPSKKPTNSAAS